MPIFKDTVPLHVLENEQLGATVMRLLDAAISDRFASNPPEQQRQAAAVDFYTETVVEMLNERQQGDDPFELTCYFNLRLIGALLTNITTSISLELLNNTQPSAKAFENLAKALVGFIAANSAKDLAIVAANHTNALSIYKQAKDKATNPKAKANPKAKDKQLV